MDVAQVVPDVRSVLGDVPEPADSDSEGARFRLFDSVTSFLERAARSQPLMLCFDDLHAADEPSLLLLQYVAGELDRIPVLIVGAYRDLDPTISEVLASTLADLARRDGVRRLALGGLSQAEVKRFVELGGGGSAPESLSATLHAAKARGLTRIELTVRVDNERAKRLYERFEFVTEALCRRHMLVDGEYKDSYLMALVYD